ncbi:MAG: inorganic phosphate transporter [Betaproteobacteria bacterium]|nr:MAG: inorganic phosphate transporter [Betaproteobacteria bacterium]
MSAIALLLLLIAVALLFDFLNGFHDSANVVATIIASRAMSARGALTLAALANLAGPFLLGVAVAETVGAEVVQVQAVSIAVVLTALFAASLWNLATWYFGIPVSSSHALVGGLVGAAATGSGFAAIQAQGLWKVAIALLASPLLGFLMALAVMQATLWLLRSATPKANVTLSRAQVLTATALALAHGANDAQKTMGVIAMGLVTLGFTPVFVVPWWVVVTSASAIALGTAAGGWRIIRTLGTRFYRIHPIHGFTSQLASAAVILGASLAGGPVSTTQVVSMSILGAGAAERKSKVRWSALNDIVIAWALTLPATALLALPIYTLIESTLRRGG